MLLLEIQCVAKKRKILAIFEGKMKFGDFRRKESQVKYEAIWFFRGCDPVGFPYVSGRAKGRAVLMYAQKNR